MRLKTTAAAAALTLTLTLPFASVPDAVAQSSSGSNPVTVNHIGVGATSTDMNFSWRTNYRGAESVKYYPPGQPDAAETVPAEEARYGVVGRSMHASISGLQPGLEYTCLLYTSDAADE